MIDAQKALYSDFLLMLERIGRDLAELEQEEMIDRKFYDMPLRANSSQKQT